ncbi:MAG: prephenate dehydrogenase [Dermatophilaceae bacterium]
MIARATPPGLVRIVGTGLIGASVGMALRAAGVQVALEDASPTAAALARDLGAGLTQARAPELDPGIVVVAVPPDVAARVVAAELQRWPRAVVTDVASVKGRILDQVRDVLANDPAGVGHLTRYVGSHPMAGRERSGAVAAQPDLFEGRPWVITPHESSAPAAVSAVTALATLVGAAVVRMSAEEHDAAVAAVSHAPQVAASLVAARLRDLPTLAVGLSGQGVRDVTRIAESDPALWTQILAGNAPAVAEVLRAMRADLDDVIAALADLSADPEVAPGARAVLARAVADGQTGRARIPGKHGMTLAAYGVVTVVVPDTPGQVARLLTEVGDLGVNLEDLHFEHAVGRPIGSVELMVVPAAVDPLRIALADLGWTVHA